MNTIEQLISFLYGNGPLVLIIPSLLLLVVGLIKKSPRLILFSNILFYPIFIALIFLQMQPYFYPFLILPVIQFYYYIKMKKQSSLT